VVNEFFDRENRTLNRRVFPAVQFQGKLNSSGELDYNFDAVRVGQKLLQRKQLAYSLSASPSALFPRVSISGFLGGQIDFANAREGPGGQVSLQATARPTQHLALQVNGDRQWLDVTSEQGRQGRLFTASVARLKATYTFSSRAFLRAIGQYVETRRDPGLYSFSVVRRDGSFQGSALFSYKLNWQSVLFLGYGDNRTLEQSGQLARADRQFFLKVSYAFQK
jgi:hypothetical protein